MKLRFVVVFICTSLFTVRASAHDGIEHIMGTVKNISANSITVQTAGNAPKEVTAARVPATMFQKDGAGTTVKALNVGARVIVNAKPNGGKWEVVSVIFSKAPPHSHMPGMKMPN